MARGLTGKFDWGRIHREDATRHARRQSLPHYGLSIDRPEFYASRRHTICLCPDRRRDHTPRALCPALPRWMTRRLPGDP